MKLGLCVTWLALLTTAAQAASNISSRYDGVYTALAEPAPQADMNCLKFNVMRIDIVKGVLRSLAGENSVAVSGFVTDEGYVVGTLQRPSHLRSELGGRAFNDDTIVAGLIEPDTGCSWIVRMRKLKPI